MQYKSSFRYFENQESAREYLVNTMGKDTEKYQIKKKKQGWVIQIYPGGQYAFPITLRNEGKFY